jgi:hypothetical protein
MQLPVVFASGMVYSLSYQFSRSRRRAVRPHSLGIPWQPTGAVPEPGGRRQPMNVSVRRTPSPRVCVHAPFFCLHCPEEDVFL